jgi:large subunit ribosomal protein L9
MKVILLDDIAKVGRRGQVRDVSDGFARNYLIPKRLALTATPGNLKGLEHIRDQQEAKAQRVKVDAEALRARLEALTLDATRQASEEGKLFGSVTGQDIVDFLEAQGVKVQRRQLQLEEPIKSLGETMVGIRLHPEVTARLKVNVVRG